MVTSGSLFVAHELYFICICFDSSAKIKLIFMQIAKIAYAYIYVYVYSPFVRYE